MIAISPDFATKLVTFGCVGAAFLILGKLGPRAHRDITGWSLLVSFALRLAYVGSDPLIIALAASVAGVLFWRRTFADLAFAAYAWWLGRRDMFSATALANSAGVTNAARITTAEGDVVFVNDPASPSNVFLIHLVRAVARVGKTAFATIPPFGPAKPHRNEIVWSYYLETNPPKIAKWTIDCAFQIMVADDSARPSATVRGEGAVRFAPKRSRARGRFGAAVKYVVAPQTELANSAPPSLSESYAKTEGAGCENDAEGLSADGGHTGGFGAETSDGGRAKGGGAEMFDAKECDAKGSDGGEPSGGELDAPDVPRAADVITASAPRT